MKSPTKDFNKSNGNPNFADDFLVMTADTRRGIAPEVEVALRAVAARGGDQGEWVDEFRTRVGKPQATPRPTSKFTM